MAATAVSGSAITNCLSKTMLPNGASISDVFCTTLIRGISMSLGSIIMLAGDMISVVAASLILPAMFLVSVFRCFRRGCASPEMR